MVEATCIPTKRPLIAQRRMIAGQPFVLGPARGIEPRLQRAERRVFSRRRGGGIGGVLRHEGYVNPDENAGK